MRTLKTITVGVIVATLLFATSSALAIENIAGKTYKLSTKHGPWMVMVTSFRNVSPEERKEGMSAEQAASELVFELREKGIPAYTFAQDAIKGEIDTRDRLGRDDHRIYAAQRDMICVLAGNYEKIDDPVGQKTLAYIKKFHPKFLKNPKSGAILRPDAAQRGPLSGAFMTINPLIKPEDVARKSVDKEIKDLNSNLRFGLVDNPHKFTLQVATFAGKSATPIGNSAYRGKESRFDAEVFNPKSALSIGRAGEDAEQLTMFLRRRKASGNGSQSGGSGLFDAYVYHSKFESIVTIGGFDSPNDPRIRTIAQYYGPKLEPDFRLLRQSNMTTEGVESLPKIMNTHTEQLFPDGADPRTSEPLQIWTFDVEPKLIAVPRLK